MSFFEINHQVNNQINSQVGELSAFLGDNLKEDRGGGTPPLSGPSSKEIYKVN
jgi:hypothetical protein